MQGTIIMESAATAPSKTTPSKPTQDNSATRKKINEHRAKLMKSVNADAYNGINLFEGTEPLSNQEASSPKGGSVALGNPADAGVDINSLMGNASKIWKAMK